MNREELENKIRALKALAEQGEGGERENAKAFLDKMMKKYNISEKDFESETVYQYFHDIDGEFSYELMNQICGKHFPKVIIINMRRKSKNVDYIKEWCRAKFFITRVPDILIESTKSDYVGLMSMYNIYWHSLVKHKDIFYLSFLQRNDLLVEAKNDKEPTKEEIEKYMKAMEMSRGIERTTINKQLPQCGIDRSLSASQSHHG